MKRIVASVGMVALGVSGVQAASDAVSSPEPVKPWSVSATLRGFYDDNINSSGTVKQDSFGFEVSPALSWKWTPQEQTSLSLGYVYSLLYYDNKPFNNTDHIDQDHTFNALFNHAFTQRYDVSVSDSFVIGQEPDTLRTGVAFNSFQRVPGDNIRNYGTINLNAQLTKVFGAQVGYANAFYQYDHTGATDDGTGNVLPSLGGTLNRLEHAIHLDGRWLLAPQTTGVLGYQYREVDYTAGEPIAGAFPPLTFPDTAFSDNRNSRMHYGYVGADHTFRPDLTGSLRVGANFTDYYNDPTQSSDVSPYAQLSLRYTYALQSYVEGGFSYDRVATDLIGFNGRDLTTDAQAAVLYGTLVHQITPRLFGSLVAQFQDDVYNNGIYNNQSDRFFLVGLNLEYRFNPHFAASVGYNYDRLDSDIGTSAAGRSFDRNRVYMGLTASY